MLLSPGCPGKVSGVQGGGKQHPSASAVSHNPAATCRLCNGKVLIAKITSVFMSLYLREGPALCKQAVRNSGFTFLLHSHPLSSGWFLACVPFRGCGQVSGNAAKDKGKHQHARGGSEAAAPPSLPLCCCKHMGRALRQPSSMLEGSRDTSNVPKLSLPCRCPGCGCFYISGLG